MTSEQQKRIQDFQLTSDIFFSIVLQDILACQEVIRIITGENIILSAVRHQETILQLVNRSIRIDIWATDSKNRNIGIEMHPQSNEERVKRNRYNISCLDIRGTAPGDDFSDIPDTWGIYITKADFLRTKKGVNKIARIIRGTNVEVQNGTAEYYVCLSCAGDNPAQSALLQYMENSDGVIESEYFPNLVKRVRFFKEEQGGYEIMCEIMDSIVKECVDAAVAEAEEKVVIAEKKISKAEKQGIENMVYALRQFNISKDQIIKQLMTQLGFSNEEAAKYL